MKMGFSAGIWSDYRKTCCKKVLKRGGINWYCTYGRAVTNNGIQYCVDANER